jgi:2-polyprenyl-3-methyl-5-hydroxy-6-metoxy-1,4-benzoquinol methylase
MRRRVEAEWLDELPAQDPRAIRSRADLARINGLMGNARIVSREIRRAFPRGLHRLAEIGAGDGRFGARLAPALGRRAEMTLVDRQDCVNPSTLRELAAHGIEAQVVRADVFDWLRRDMHERYDVIVANLFLHHFEDDRLAEVLRLVARRTRHFIACEPRRSWLALAGSRALGLIGCNDVTRHDAVASVRAGFRDGELGAAWPREDGWSLTERACAPFGHCFVARRP